MMMVIAVSAVGRPEFVGLAARPGLALSWPDRPAGTLRSRRVGLEAKFFVMGRGKDGLWR